jgi:uncharacterized protein with FMN-binding domain
MIPKRAVGALVSTVLGLVLLLSFKTPETSGVASTGGRALAGVDQPVGGTGQSAKGAQTKAGYTDGTTTGQVVSTRYGDVQVQVTVSGGSITDVTALQLPDRDGHSARISSAVEPMLRSMALQAQSANIDLVSGATYTSGAYRESLQSALDSAAR